MMCEIPSNVLLAEEFLDLVDGMSIGSNDLTQLTLGLDRDSGIVTSIGNENDESVRALISTVIRKCVARKKYLGICGQGPSDLPDFAAKNGVVSQMGRNWGAISNGISDAIQLLDYQQIEAIIRDAVSGNDHFMPEIYRGQIQPYLR